MRYFIGFAFVAFMLIVPGAGRADVGGVHPGVPAKDGQVTPEERAAIRLSSSLVDFCNKNIVKYRNALAVLRTPVVVPEPPPVPPGCSQCGEKGANESQSAADQWFKKAEQPETQATSDLLSILRVMTMLGYDPNANVHFDNTALTPLAKQCMKQFDVDTIKESVSKLIDRQYNGKALPMAQKYRKDPDRARAGIPFVLAAARAYALWGSNPNGDDPAMSVVGDWMRNVYSVYDKKIFSDHLYYWCPSYFAILRELALASGGETSTSAADFMKTARRLTDYMHFKVKLDISMIENDQDKHTNVHWTGESDLSFALFEKDSCYTPNLRQGSLMMTVDNWTMRGKDGSINLVGPHVFEAPVGTVKINLCSQNPQLDLVFANFGPPSKIDQPMAPPIPVFSGVMNSVLADDAKKSGRLQSTTQSAKESMQSLKDQISKHSNDQAWLMSAEGQAVIAKITKLSMGATGDAMQGGTPTISHITNELITPWQNGTPNVVDKSLTLDNDHGHFTLHLTIVHDPQNNSETGPYH
jgi:hypothetical protein